MKKFLYRLLALSALCISLAFVACSDSEEVLPPDPKPPIDKPEPLSESHTLILFMQGDNGLEEFMDLNLQKTIMAYYKIPTELGRIVVFYDRGNYTRLTELYMDDGMAKQRLIKEYSVKQSTVDPLFVKEVFDLIKVEAPASSYGLILSSHGGGWVPSKLYDLYLENDIGESHPLRRPLYYGQDGYDCMEIPDLAASLQGWEFDYIIFDACFMASVEALYDMRHCADYIIASSAEVLGEGFPYQEIIPLLFSTNDHSLKEACEAFMELYRESSGTISLIDCDDYQEMAEVMRRIHQEVGAKLVDASQIQAYEGFDLHLFFDLEQYVEQLISDPALLSEFRGALADLVEFTDHSQQFYTSTGDEERIPLPRSCGLTCHVPQKEAANTHAAFLETQWAKDTMAQ
uniref:clostripain-related cysteine peptidase n=1 Tax=Alistipes sp. TaxID=1872444 RepID=UPI0040577BEF